MNLRAGLFMSVVLVAAGAYVYRAEYLTDAPVENTTEVVALPGIKPSEIQKFIVKNSKGEIQIEREGYSPLTERGASNFKPKKGGDLSWVLSIPPGAPTNSPVVEKILGGATALKTKVFIEEGEVGDLAVYGLTNPESSLEIEGGFGTRKLNFGKQSTISKRRYLSVDGDKRVLMVDESLFLLLSQPTDKLRDEHPIKFNPAEVASVTVRRSTPSDTVEFKKDQGEWKATVGEAAVTADSAEMDQILSQLSTLTVSRFVDEPDGALALYGLKEPRAVVSIRLARNADINNPADVIFYLGEGVSIKPKPEEEQEEGTLPVSATKAVFAKLVGDPTIYELKASPLPFLTRTLPDYRDKEPLRSVGAANVTEATISLSGKQPFTLQRDESGWKLKDGAEAATINQEKAQAWFASLIASRVLSYQDGSQHHPDEFTDHITLKLVDGTELRVDFGKALSSGTESKQVKPEERPKWVNFDIKGANRGIAVLPAQKVADILRDQDFFKNI